MADKITSFTHLRTWQKAREFAIYIYKITSAFPSSEKFGLTAQFRRSSTSVAANIAEGFSRSGQNEKRNFYSIALGSLTETVSHSFIAHDLGYLSKDDLKFIEDESVEMSKMINGMIKSAQGRNT